MIVSNHNKYDGDGGGGVAANSPDNECCFGKKKFFLKEEPNGIFHSYSLCYKIVNIYYFL
jgi:hypothetical protein